MQENSTIDITLGTLTEINPASVPVQSATVDSGKRGAKGVPMRVSNDL